MTTLCGGRGPHAIGRGWTVTERYNGLPSVAAPGIALPPPRDPADLWARFVRAAGPSGSVLSGCRLRLVLPFVWEIAIRPGHRREVAEHLPDLESALSRVYGGTPKLIVLREAGE